MRSFETGVAAGKTSEPPSNEHAFGTPHHHKSAKALLGVAVLIVASFLFYEMGSKANGESASAPVAAQRLAHVSHH